MKTSSKFLVLLYDASWGLSVFRPSADDPLYEATTDYSRLPHADAVVFHVPTAPNLRTVKKHAGQQWVAYSFESDVYYPQLRDAAYMAHFDFTISYRWDSDVPLMYWEPAWRQRLLAPHPAKTEAADAVFFSSNLQERSGRTEYIRELMQHLKVDCYGRAFGNRQLARDDGRETKLETIGRHRFDLAFENSISRDYVSEKFFDPLVSGCVPVYRGAPNIADFMPGDRCFINAADFRSPKELAERLRFLAANPAEYEGYFAWKQRPLRQSFLEKAEVAERDPFHRLCEKMMERGCRPRTSVKSRIFAWPWPRQTNAC